MVHSRFKRSSRLIESAAFPSLRVKSDTHTLGMNPSRNVRWNTLLRTVSIMQPMSHPGTFLRRFSRSGRNCFPFEARLGRSFLLGRSFPLNLFAPSFLATSSTSHLFCLHHNQIDLLGSPHSTISKFLLRVLIQLFPSLLINFSITIPAPRPHLSFSFPHHPSSTFPYPQEPKPEPLSFQRQPSPITRQVPLAANSSCPSRTPYHTRLHKTMRSHSYRNTEPKPLTA